MLRKFTGSLVKASEILHISQPALSKALRLLETEVDLKLLEADARVDIGITYAPVPTSGVDFTEVTRVTMGVYGRADRFGASDFRELPFVIPLLPAAGTPSKVAGLDGWPDHRAERHIKFKVTMMESALELCRSGQAVAYLPEFVVRLHNQYLLPKYQLQAFKAPLPQKDRQQSVYLLQRKNFSETALVRQIAKRLRALS